MAKFLTLNTHSWMEEEQETKLNQLAERILQEKYDVICLQEVNQLMESEQVVQAPFYQTVEGAIAIHQDHFALCLVKNWQKQDWTIIGPGPTIISGLTFTMKVWQSCPENR